MTKQVLQSLRAGARLRFCGRCLLLVILPILIVTGSFAFIRIRVVKTKDKIMERQKLPLPRVPTVIGPPEEEKARLTSHWCHSRDFLPDAGSRSTCLFHHLCIIRAPSSSSKQEVQWLYVVDSDTKKNEPLRDTSFSLGVGHMSTSYPNELNFQPVPISIELLQSKFPKRRYIQGTSVVYFEYNSENFGHMLTDVLMPIYSALESFGLEGMDVNLFRYSIQAAKPWSCDYHRNLPGIGYGDVGAHCDHFYGMMANLTKGHKPIQVLNGTTVHPTCFQNLVVGTPLYSDDCLEPSHGRKQDQWQLCNHGRQRQFWNFRNYVLTNAGVNPASPPTKHKITITKPSVNRRSLSNLDDLIFLIRKKYSDMEVVVTDWASMSIADQLDLIQSTTVHITPPGGISFIAIFLPRWATSIRLYKKDFRIDWHFFHYLGYLTVEHVDCTQGAIIPIKETMGLIASSLKRYDTFRIASGNGQSNQQ